LQDFSIFAQNGSQQNSNQTNGRQSEQNKISFILPTFITGHPGGSFAARRRQRF
jgi:hypothetical protein